MIASGEFEYKEHKTLNELKIMALSDLGPQIYSVDVSSANQIEVLTMD